MTEETIFSRIIRKEISATIVFENDRVLAFKDISPQAPTHILVIPKTALPDVASAKSEDKELLGELLLTAAAIADEQGLTNYRIVINNGTEAGQTVFHLHLHLLAGRPMQWPPG